jgi:hypothetical protein
MDDALEERREKLQSEAGNEMNTALSHLRAFADDMPPDDWLKDIANEKMEKISESIDVFRKELEAQNAQRRKEIEILKTKLADLRQRWAALERGKYFSRAARQMSVFCLTPESTSYNMWTLYADGFRGVCIGFDRERLTAVLSSIGADIVGPLAVKYRKLTIDDITSPKFINQPKNLYLYKPKAWASEKEVRFVRRDGRGLVRVPTNCITEIILGNRVERTFRDMVAEFITQKIKKAEIDDGRFLVHQASGDSEGRVHIDTNDRMDSLNAALRNDYFGRCQELDYRSRNDTTDEDDLPF